MVGGAAELAGDACAERHVAGDLSMRRLAGAGAGWTRDEGDGPRRTGVGRLRTADGRGRLLSVGTRREVPFGVGGGEVRCGFVRLLPERGAGAGGEACCGLGGDGAGPVRGAAWAHAGCGRGLAGARGDGGGDAGGGDEEGAGGVGGGGDEGGRGARGFTEGARNEDHRGACGG